MNQQIVSSRVGFTPFPAEQLPSFVLGANRGAATPPPAYAALRVALMPSIRELYPREEEAERWDGLS